MDWLAVAKLGMDPVAREIWPHSVVVSEGARDGFELFDWLSALPAQLEAQALKDHLALAEPHSPSAEALPKKAARL